MGAILAFCIPTRLAAILAAAAFLVAVCALSVPSPIQLSPSQNWIAPWWWAAARGTFEFNPAIFAKISLLNVSTFLVIATSRLLWAIRSK